MFFVLYLWFSYGWLSDSEKLEIKPLLWLLPHTANLLSYSSANELWYFIWSLMSHFFVVVVFLLHCDHLSVIWFGHWGSVSIESKCAAHRMSPKMRRKFLLNEKMMMTTTKTTTQLISELIVDIKIKFPKKCCTTFHQTQVCVCITQHFIWRHWKWHFIAATFDKNHLISDQSIPCILCMCVCERESINLKKTKPAHWKVKRFVVWMCACEIWFSAVFLDETNQFHTDRLFIDVN